MENLRLITLAIRLENDDSLFQYPESMPHGQAPRATRPQV